MNRVHCEHRGWRDCLGCFFWHIGPKKVQAYSENSYLTRLIGHGRPGQVHGIQGNQGRLQQARPGLWLLHNKSRADFNLTESFWLWVLKSELKSKQLKTLSDIIYGSCLHIMSMWAVNQKRGANLNLREDGENRCTNAEKHVDADEDLVLSATIRVGVVYVEHDQRHQR